MSHRLLGRFSIHALLLTVLIAGTAWAADTVFHFDIPSQSLGSALRTFGQTAGEQIIFTDDLVAGMQSATLRGDFSAAAALEKLLAGTGLRAERSATGVLMIRKSAQRSGTARIEAARPEASAPPQGVAQGDQAGTGTQATSSEGREVLDEVVVTGSHIHGQQETAAPITTISRTEIDQTGYSSTQDLLAHLPQNFNELSAAGGFGAGTSRIASENSQVASAVSLHGLGPDATLTLLNGERRPGTVNGQVTDVSIIPLSVIDHIDVVYGGNSAIYGADAVAGVVNIVTRQDYDGALSEANYSAGEHGGDHLQLSQLFGLRSDWGGFLAAFDYSGQKPMNAVKAGYVISPSVAGIIPEYLPAASEQTIRSGYLSGHAQVGPVADAYVHALYSDSSTDSDLQVEFPGLDLISRVTTDTTTYTVDAGTHIKLGSAWQLTVAGNYGRVNSAEPFTEVLVPGGSLSGGNSANDAKEVGYSAIADGSIPLGAEHSVKAAIGLERREEEYFSTNLGTSFVQSNKRHVNSAFLELDVPLVKNGAYAGLRTLDLNLAARYDDYSDFGHTTNPQAGLIWRPVDGFSVRGSYARSFRAPELYELGSEPTIVLSPFSDPQGPGGVSPVFDLSGGNPGLGPETANTYTFGVDFDPTLIPGTHLHLSYFDIRYSGRIEQVDVSSALADPAAYASLINRNPSEAELQGITNQVLAKDPAGLTNQTGVPFDPATQNFLTTFPGLVFFDQRFQNLAVQSVRGIDFKTDSSVTLGANTLSGGLEGSYYLTFRRQLDALLPSVNLTNTVGQPAKFRARAQAGITHGSLSAFGYVNYVNAYTDNIAVPNIPISSWTTVDLALRWNPVFEATRVLPENIDVSLAAQNLFNRAPPVFRNNFLGLGFDPTNANGLGRVISLRLAAKW